MKNAPLDRQALPRRTLPRQVLRTGIPALLIIAFGVWFLRAPGRGDAVGQNLLMPAAADDFFSPDSPIADKRVQRMLVRVVQQQMDAFRRQDFKAALMLATGDMRSQNDPEKFGELIRHSYPKLITAQKIEYAPAERRGGAAMLPVTLTDAQGERAYYMFRLARDANGWSVVTCMEASQATFMIGTLPRAAYDTSDTLPQPRPLPGTH